MDLFIIHWVERSKWQYRCQCFFKIRGNNQLSRANLTLVLLFSSNFLAVSYQPWTTNPAVIICSRSDTAGIGIHLEKEYIPNNNELTGHLLSIKASTVLFTRKKFRGKLVLTVLLTICDRPSWKHGVVQLSWQTVRFMKRNTQGATLRWNHKKNAFRDSPFNPPNLNWHMFRQAPC